MKNLELLEDPFSQKAKQGEITSSFNTVQMEWNCETEWQGRTIYIELN